MKNKGQRMSRKYPPPSSTENTADHILNKPLSYSESLLEFHTQQQRHHLMSINLPKSRDVKLTLTTKAHKLVAVKTLLIYIYMPVLHIVKNSEVCYFE